MHSKHTARLSAAFAKEYGTEPERFYFCPGRVNIIGEHLDYNGGRVLPAAVNLGIYAALRRRPGRVLRFASAGFPGRLELSIDEHRREPEPETSEWTSYVRAVVRAVSDLHSAPEPADVYYYSTLPAASGLSSSAALEVLTAYMLIQQLAGAATPPSTGAELLRMVELCKRVENEYLGLKSGIMDQYAVAFGEPNRALLLDCSVPHHTSIEMRLGEFIMVGLVTGKLRALVESEYNNRHAECQAALAEIRKSSPIPALAQASHAHVESLSDPLLRKRARHVVSEQERVTSAVDALQTGNTKTLGKLLVDSHESLRVDFEVTGRELDEIVAAALNHSACIGARMTGAGFGGCALALVSRNGLENFSQAVCERYRKAVGLDARILPLEAGAGVSELAV